MAFLLPHVIGWGNHKFCPGPKGGGLDALTFWEECPRHILRARGMGYIFALSLENSVPRVIIRSNHYLFDAPIAPYLACSNFFKLASFESFWHILSILWLTSLFSGTRCSRLSLPFPCSIPRVSHFCKEPGFLLMQSGVYKMRFGPQECPLLLGSVTASFSVQSYGIHTHLQLYFSSMRVLKAIRSHLYLLFQSGITECILILRLSDIFKTALLRCDVYTRQFGY